MSKYNKPIMSMADAKKEIGKYGLVCSRGSCRINNNFQTKVAKNLVNKLFNEGKLIIAPAIGQWFEEGYRLKKEQ